MKAVADAVYARGGNMVLVVLTAAHGKATPLAEIKALVATASRKARSGKGWKMIEQQYGVLGVVVGQEVTFSHHNGPHFHQHLSIAVDGDEDEAMAAGRTVASRYRAEVEKAGGKVSGKHGCFVRVAHNADDASNYTAKGSAAWEVAGGPTKTKTKSNKSFTPWDLAAMAFAGNAWARERWDEYVQVMPGTRSCVISPRLAKALGISSADDKEPGEQVVHETDDVIGSIPSLVWSNLMRASLASTFLARVELGGEAKWDETRTWAITQSEQIESRTEDQIPYEAPQKPFVQPPRPEPPLATSVRELLWTPSPPIVRSPRPIYVPPPRAAHLPAPPRKPDFLMVRAKAVA